MTKINPTQIKLEDDYAWTGTHTVTTVWHAYGGFQGQSETLTMSGWTWITNATNDLWTGLEGDGMSLSGDIMTITNAGDYTGILVITFQGALTKDFHIRLYNITTDSQVGYTTGDSGAGVGNTVSLTLPLYIESGAGDTFRIEMYEATDSPPTLYEAVFNITYLHS